MSLRPLDAARLDLHGLQLIEASAGTGKTWTIAALYLRLVLEAELPVERILVVTYTRAATAELRERIRARLAAALEAIDRAAAGQGLPPDDAVLSALLQKIELARARRLLALALESFDLAAIHTIHGFCQRALAERAFESGADFDSVMASDDGRFLREAAEDFWRREMASAPVFWARWLLQNLPGPGSLLAKLRAHFGKPYLHPLAPAPAAASEARFQAAWLAARSQWHSAGAAAVALLHAHGNLNRSSHKSEQIAAAASDVADYLQAAEATLPLPTTLRKLSASVLREKTNGKHAPPQHALFETLDTLYAEGMALEAALQARLGALLQRAWHECEAAARAKKQQLGERSFDDLLLDLYTALNGEGGAALAAALRQRYGAALIDEFQDTDPLQYAIFTQLFATQAMTLFFVGDPKQAIYGFRGADLHAYLAARKAAGSPWALTVNRRSRPALVAAVNALFAAQARPFMVDALEFSPVAASDAPPPPLLIEGEEVAALEFWCMAREAGESLLGKTEAVRQIAAAVADDIARLLNLGSLGEAKIETRSLCGGDIAILVKSHSQGRRMHEALLERGIACVRYGQESVYRSAEALAVERILLAVAEPGREALVRVALVSDLLGWRAQQLLALDAGAEDAVQQRQRFYDYHALAAEHGFIRMWRILLDDFGVAARLLALPAGERRMTNLQHLGDLLQTLAHDEGIGVEALAKHLADERAAPGDEDGSEARLLRLESDEAVVKIVTIHSSKGLEYPVVYCPFLWDGTQRSLDVPLRFHDPAQGYRSSLDFGSARLVEHEEHARAEAREEALRLAYVALTRAKHRCVTIWGALRDAAASPLAWLLFGEASPDLAKIEDGAVLRPLRDLAAACPHVVLRPLPLPAQARQQARPARSRGLQARSFPARSLAPWHMHSYSAWAASAAQLGARTAAELPDHDALAFAPDAAVGGLGAGEFPCGAQAGSCLHTLLQHADFASGRVDVGNVLRSFGLAARHESAATELLARALNTPLDAAGLRLNALARGAQQREMAFTLPLARPDLSILASAIGAGEGADGRLAERVRALQAPALAGFLKGFIDLVFVSEGRYCIADYKSNWLGAAPADYADDKLVRAMAAANYDLQALLYVLALHRLLQWRLPDYAYDKHMGGAYYLFLRGMRPQTAGSGVHFWRPSRALVERVAACLLRTERLLTC